MKGGVTLCCTIKLSYKKKERLVIGSNIEQRRGSKGTCHGDLIAWLGVTKEVGADSLLCGILGILLWVPVGGSPDTQAGCLGIKVVAISG